MLVVERRIDTHSLQHELKPGAHYLLHEQEVVVDTSTGNECTPVGRNKLSQPWHKPREGRTFATSSARMWIKLIE